jgi:hypothetical protein
VFVQCLHFTAEDNRKASDGKNEQTVTFSFCFQFFMTSFLLCIVVSMRKIF